MKNCKHLIVLLLLGFFGCSISTSAQQMEVIKVTELEALMSDQKQGLTVINFWATWCKPCVKELPYFTDAQTEFSDVNFLYISIDFVENLEKAERFATKKGLNPQGLYLIDDLDYNSWIDKVSPDWSGAIPATLLIKNGEKFFYEKEFHEGELKDLLKEKLN